MKTFAFGVVSFAFGAATVVACAAGGNPVDGAGAATGPSGNAGVDSGAADSSFGSTTDSGSTTTADSGSATPIDSGTVKPPDDAGVIFTGGGTCDITSGLTITLEEIVTFITENSPASCGSSAPCDSSHCCLDVAAASGSGSLPFGTPTGICLTTLDLSALGL